MLNQRDNSLRNGQIETAIDAQNTTNINRFVVNGEMDNILARNMTNISESVDSDIDFNSFFPLLAEMEAWVMLYDDMLNDIMLKNIQVLINILQILMDYEPPPEEDDSWSIWDIVSVIVDVIIVIVAIVAAVVAQQWWLLAVIAGGGILGGGYGYIQGENPWRTALTGMAITGSLGGAGIAASSAGMLTSWAIGTAVGGILGGGFAYARGEDPVWGMLNGMNFGSNIMQGSLFVQAFAAAGAVAMPIITGDPTDVWAGANLGYGAGSLTQSAVNFTNWGLTQMGANDPLKFDVMENTDYRKIAENNKQMQDAKDRLQDSLDWLEQNPGANAFDDPSQIFRDTDGANGAIWRDVTTTLEDGTIYTYQELTPYGEAVQTSFGNLDNAFKNFNSEGGQTIENMQAYINAKNDLQNIANSINLPLNTDHIDFVINKMENVLDAKEKFDSLNGARSILENTTQGLSSIEDSLNYSENMSKAFEALGYTDALNALTMIRNIIEAIKNQNQMVGNTPAQQLLERENAEYLEMLYNLTNKRTLGDFKLDSFNLIMTGEQLNKCVKFFNDLLGNNQNIFEIMNAPFRSAYLEMTVLNASMMFETILIPMFKNIQATFLIQFNKSFDYAFGAGILAKRTSSLVGYDITDKIQ